MRKGNCLKKTGGISPSLFPAKARYLLDHTNTGANIFFRTLPQNVQRKLKCDNMHLIGDMRFTEENGMPILSPYDSEHFDFELYSYNERNKHGKTPWAVHFFQHDYTFLKAVTERLERTTRALYDCSVIFAPDCSLYVDAPTFINKLNIFRSRFAAAYWQSCGYNVIQTASWGNADSLAYAFEGLAEHSITAVSGRGHDICEASKRLWHYAISKLIEQKSPTKIIVYGGKEDGLSNLGVPVIFIEDFIAKHFRKKELCTE